VIRFSAGLVVVAIGVLCVGGATSKLSLVYVAIAVSAFALIVLAIGVVLKREELFGDLTREGLLGDGSELVPAGAGTSAGSPAPGRSVSAPQSAAAPPPSPASPVPLAGQERSAYGLLDGAASAAAFAPATAVRPIWTPKEPEPQSARGRAAAPAGGWGSTSTPPSGTPSVAPRAWDGAKETPSSPSVPSVPASGDVTSGDAGSAGALRSWFDRPAQAKPSPRSAVETSAPADQAPAPRPADTVVTPADTVVTPVDTRASGDVDAPADEDDDWPTRYSWLDEEEADEAVESDDVPLESDDAVAAEVAASDLPEPTSPEASKSPAATAGAEEAAAEHVAAEHVAAEKADAAETAAPAAAPAALEGTDAADEAPVLPSVTDPAAESGAEPSAEDKPPAEDKPSAKQESGTKMVSVVPGVPRYHEPDCILIRFMPSGDVQTKSIPEAKAAKCTPCAACQPED
jgi:hypothetical protein